MVYAISPKYILGAGLLLFLVVGFFIRKQNLVLVKAGAQYGYTAYNWKKTDRDELVRVWKNPPYTKAVRQIIGLDIIWMLIFGASIFYGLWLVVHRTSSSGNWVYVMGMILIVAMVIIDGLQDASIYRHLVHGTTFDVRGLTTLKFSLLIISFLILTTGLIRYWRVVSV